VIGSMGIVLVLWIMLIFSEPGCLKPRLDIGNRVENREREVVIKGVRLEIKHCVTCRSDRPIRSHHCALCNLCVMELDHHCPWLSNCIGYKNRRLFITFLFSLSLQTAYLSYFLLQFLFNNYTPPLT
jgi:hypothetical protein